jgi:hypothetical protein
MTATNNSRNSRRFTWALKNDETPHITLINTNSYSQALQVLEDILKSEYDLEIDQIEIIRCETLT